MLGKKSLLPPRESKMTIENILHCLRENSIRSLVGDSIPMPTPLPVSPWVAMSVLQKSIRRGEPEWAFRAASTLLVSAPDRLWRRLGCAAFEDVGVGDIDVVSTATIALAGKRFRSEAGGEWAVASNLISQLTRAAKCRAADDLLMAAELVPEFGAFRLDFALQKAERLLELAASDIALPARALALWYAIGTDRRPSPHLKYRRGDPELVFEALPDLGCSIAAAVVAREGFRRLGEVLCPFVALLESVVVPPYGILDDALPVEISVEGVPSWSLDLYSREGKAGLRRFLRSGAKSSRMSSALFSQTQRLPMLGHALFRVEGGQTRRRLHWSVGDNLRSLMDQRSFAEVADGTEFVECVRADVGLINDARIEAMEGYHG
jgi:hypothetical protein